MSRRVKIIAIVSVLLVSGIIALAVLAPKSGNADGYQTACESLIAAIAKKDFDASYGLLSSAAKTADTKEEWKDKTAVLGNIYEYAEVTIDARVAPSTSSDTNQPTHIQMSYTIAGPAAKSDVSCIATEEDGTYVVDGFSSRLHEEAAQ